MNILESVSAESLRNTRQVHSASTVARLPSEAFAPLADHIFAQLNEPLLDRDIPGFRTGRQLDFTRQNAPLQQGPSSTKWELGYDASDILSPPGANSLQVAESNYDTVRTYSRQNVRPNPARDIDSSATIIWGTIKPGAKINIPEEAAVQNQQLSISPASSEHNPAVSGQRYRFSRYAKQPSDVHSPLSGGERTLNKRDYDYDEDHHEDVDEGDHGHKGSSGPVYTYVKTDKNGHFKWAVRHASGH